VIPEPDELFWARMSLTASLDQMAAYITSTADITSLMFETIKSHASPGLVAALGAQAANPVTKKTTTAAQSYRGRESEPMTAVQSRFRIFASSVRTATNFTPSK
jgi:hypothetical protein